MLEEGEAFCSGVATAKESMLCKQSPYLSYINKPN